MRVIVQGDVGQQSYHVGDEAMTLAAVDELTARGHQAVLLSRDPEQTSQHYQSQSEPTLEFPWPPREREEYLQRIRAVLAGDRSALAVDDKFFALEAAIVASDAVIISGGGNMTSLFGWLLYERAAVGLIARARGKPLVISGQTFGPALSETDAEVLAELLGTATLVGVREDDSYRLALSLGVDSAKLVKVLDDASFLKPRTSAALTPSGGVAQVEVPHRYIAATIGPESWRDGITTIPAVAEALDAAAELTGLPVLLVPHMGCSNSPQRDDLGSHNEVLAHSRSAALTALPLLEARSVVALTAGAEMVISNRYHPVVFASSASVPTVALSGDNYSDVRIAGALANWGLSDFAIPSPALALHGFRAAISEAWQRRDAIRAHLLNQWAAHERSQETLWEAVVQSLGNSVIPAPSGRGSAEPFVADGAWAAEARALRPWFRQLSARVSEEWLSWDRERSVREGLQEQNQQVSAQGRQASPSRALAAIKTALRGGGRR